MRRRLGPALAVLLLAACDAPDDVGDRGCFPRGDATPRRRGGWDANGVSLQGRAAERAAQPGKETHGIYLGIADLDGARLVDAHSGAPVRLVDGRVVADGDELVATTLDGRSFAVALGARAPHPEAPELETIELVVDGQPVCEPGDHGVLLEGRWDAHGDRVDAPGVLTYACGSGVLAKCAAWGWSPWRAGTDAHQACARMARADYCGDGVAWTLAGTPIDAFDRVQPPRDDADGFAFEAAWGPDGVVCVARSRWDIVDAHDEAVRPRCFDALPRCDALTDAPEALLANASRPQTIAVCE